MASYLLLLTDCMSKQNTTTSNTTLITGIFGRLFLVIALALLWLVTFGLEAPMGAGEPGRLWVPAIYVQDLTLPGTVDNLLRPGRVFVDHESGETFVADGGNGRVVIFDENDMFLFEFSVAEFVGVPKDLVVDSKGFIYVLGSAGLEGQLSVFDFDGRFVRSLAVVADDTPVRNLSSMVLDGDDRLYVLDKDANRILRLYPDGIVEKQFSLSLDESEDIEFETVLGSLTISGDVIYLPESSAATVHRFTLDGDYLGSVGHMGSELGGLAFPVSTAVTSDGIVMVLDKHRYLVVCYTLDGKFLGEFGGKGINSGWFYHPQWLAASSDGRVYVGQIYNHRVQVCLLPEFVRERNELAGMDSEITVVEKGR